MNTLHNDNDSLGCEVCKRMIYGTGSLPNQVAVHPDGPTFLYCCDVCSTYWHVTLRYSTPVSEEKAAELYPSAFSLA
jgi:hypothetical protein